MLLAISTVSTDMARLPTECRHTYVMWRQFSLDSGTESQACAQVALPVKSVDRMGLL